MAQLAKFMQIRTANIENWNIIKVQVIFYFLWAHPGYLENQIPLKPALGGVSSLGNYSVAYQET